MKLQLELNRKSLEPRRYHSQGFAKLRKSKQLEVGYYNSDTKEGAEVKKIFQANFYLDFADRTDDQYLNIDDITDQIITNISKSKPREQVIAFSSNVKYQTTKRKINIVEATSSKKQKLDNNINSQPESTR
ncbi:7727_t:CDS:2 [Dentiscutata heterogama]|uniref:7727_t:CDS:1 n=1 Tax=Dentiscutata heterogama TaxID=1316150 RepID=A0ACA9KPI6_9GLOM|nr:7727_t:CDS:2 [Dentiscutata heterogama]